MPVFSTIYAETIDMLCPQIKIRAQSQKRKELDALGRRVVVRVSDQHGNRHETAARLLPRGGGKARCTTWCEELQVRTS